MSERWTVERVKEELPDVQVKFPDGTIMSGLLSGSKLTYPLYDILDDYSDRLAFSVVADSKEYHDADWG